MIRSIFILLILVVLQVFSQLCSKGSDCPNGYCCISNIQPVGRRQLHLGGYCSKLPQAGESCLYTTNPQSDYLNSLVLQCPCTSGTECVRDPNGYFIVPIGYSGTCI